MLREWGDTTARALAHMIDDIRAGKLYDDTMEEDFRFLRHLMGRHEVLVGELRKHESRHRGPGTVEFEETGGTDTCRATSP